MDFENSSSGYQGLLASETRFVNQSGCQIEKRISEMYVRNMKPATTEVSMERLPERRVQSSSALTVSPV